MSKLSVILLGFLAWALLCVLCIWMHLPEFMKTPSVTAPNINANVNQNNTTALGAPSLKVMFENGKARLTGTLPDQAAKDKVIARAREVYGEGNFIDELKVGGVSAPAWLSSALALFPFAKNGVTNGGLTAEGNSISLIGQVPDDAAKTKIYKDAVAAAPNVTINNLLTVGSEKPLNQEQAATQAKLNEQLTGKIVEFDTGKDTLTDRGKKTLDELVPIFKGSPDNIEIVGHTDNQGDKAKNQALSERRAAMVKKYLVDKGLDTNRFTTKGYGQDNPIADNATPEGKQRNRRIEFQVKGGN